MPRSIKTPAARGQKKKKKLEMQFPLTTHALAEIVEIALLKRLPSHSHPPPRTLLIESDCKSTSFSAQTTGAPKRNR